MVTQASCQVCTVVSELVSVFDVADFHCAKWLLEDAILDGGSSTLRWKIADPFSFNYEEVSDGDIILV